MSPTVLFSRAKFDLVTHYLAAYSTKLIDFAKENNYNIVDLYNDDPSRPARLSTFETEIEKKPDVFIGCGHGNSSEFTGQDLEVLLKAGVNADAASNVKSYLWACQTGNILGPQMVSNTCPEFYGYTADWCFLYHPEYETTPLDDPYAKAFFDSGLATGYALLLGKSPQEVYQITIDRYKYWWDFWLKKNDPMADDILTWLNWNRSNFVVVTPGGLYQTPSTASISIPPLIPVLGIAGALLFLFTKT